LLVGFTDSDWVDDLDNQKSTGYVFNLGSEPVTWACKKQQALSLSSQKRSTEQQLMQVKKPCGFNKSFQSLASSNSI
jgi:hypothetical protein